MSEAASTIVLRVDSSQAKTGLQELNTAIAQFKTSLSNLGTLTDGYSKLREEVQALKTQLREYQSGVKTGAEAEVQSVSKSKAVWASHRATLDGVGHSYKTVSKLTREQVDAEVAAAEATKKAAAERKVGLLQMAAAAEDAKRLRERLNGSSTSEELHKLEMQASANRIALEQRTRAQLKLEQDLEIADAKAAARARLTAATEAERLLEAQRLRTARFAAASPSSQLTTLKTAAAFGAQGGDVSSKFGTEIASLANQTEIAKRTNELAEATKRVTSATTSNTAANALAKQQLAEHSAAVAHHREQQAMLHSTLRGVAGGMDNLWLTYGRYVGHMIGAYAAITAARKSMADGVELDYQSRFISALGNDRSPDAYKQIQQGLYGVQDAPASVNELAASLRTLQQTGVDASQGLGLLPTVIAASTLGETTMKTATEDLVGVLEVFNLHSENPVKLAANFKAAGDVMAYVAQETKANLHDVASSMQGVTGVAEQYGVKIETAAAAISMLGKQGITGSRAGTYTRSMMESLYVPTSAKAEKVTKELDFSMFDKAGNVKDNLQGILELVEKIKKYDPQSQAKMIDSLFPAWGAKAFRSIFNDVDAFIAKQKEAGAQTGLLAREQEELSKSTRYQLQQLGADWDNLFTKAGSGNELLAEPIQALRDALKDPNTVEGLKAIVSELVKLGAFAAQHTDDILMVVKALGALAVGQAAAGALTMLGSAGAVALPILSGLAAPLLAASGAMGPTVTGALGLRAALGTLPAALAGLSLPLTALVGAAAAAGTAFYLFRDRTFESVDGIRERVGSMADSVQKRLADLMVNLKSMSALAAKSVVDSSGEALISANKGLEEQAALLKKNYGLANEAQIEAAYASAKKSGPAYMQTQGTKAVAAYLETRDRRNELATSHYAAKSALTEKQDEEARAAKELADKQAAAAGKPLHYDGSKKDRAAENDLSRAAVKRMESAINLAKKEYQTLAAQIDTDVENFTISKSEGIARKYQAEINSLLQQATSIRGEIEFAQRRGKKADETAARGKLAEVEEATNTAMAKVTLDLTKNQQELNKETAAYVIAKRDESEELAFQIELIGKTELEVKKLTAARQAELEYKKKAFNFTVVDGEVKSIAKENQPELEREFESAKKRKEQMLDTEYKAQRSFTAGWDKAYQDYIDSSTNSATLAADAFKSGTGMMEDAIFNLTTNTKASYKDMVQSVLKDLARMAAKQAAMGLIKLGVSAASSYFGSGNVGAGQTVANTSSTYSTPVSTPSVSSYELNAHGNVYGSNSLSRYSNNVYSSPRSFELFAHGAGIFAERGPEAIMPLTRTATGDLGVRAIGGGGGGGGEVSVVVNVTIESDGSSNTETTATGSRDLNAKALGETVGAIVKKTLVEEMRSGGLLEKVRTA